MDANYNGHGDNDNDDALLYPNGGHRPPTSLSTHSGESRLLISRSALMHNAAVVRRAIGPNVKVCAMVKANAYGHGATVVADALASFSDPAKGYEAPAVDALAVATIEEAANLNFAHAGLPVIVFQPVENAFAGLHRGQIELALQSNWVLTLCSKSAADDVARIAAAIGGGRGGASRHLRANVQVMIDTGMARSGESVHRARELIDRVAVWPSLRLISVCTHFASAEVADDPFAAEQLQQFDAVTCDLAGKVMRHACNSAGTFFVPRGHYDMVRPGIALYGVDPLCRPSMDRPLRPVMKWVAPLVGVRDIPAGTGVGYNHTWRASRPTRLGLVPIGYADGYLRTFSNQAFMIVQGQPVPVVGRVSMDLTTVDLTDVPAASIGDEVTVLDNDPLSPASAYALAKLAGTIPYEIFCRIGPRVKRVAVDPTDAEIAATRRDQGTESASGITEFDW